MRRRRQLYPFIVILAVSMSSLAVTMFILSGEASATAETSLNAQQNMSSLATSDNVVEAPPDSLSRLPEGVSPGRSAIHQLSTSMFAWLKGSGVCYEDTNGNGGCFEVFLGGCNCTLADPDELGRGLPAYVAGLVPDSVKAVSVEIAGRTYDANVRSNVFRVEAASPTVKPWDITSALVTFDDGTQVTVALGSGKAPPGLS